MVGQSEATGEQITPKPKQFGLSQIMKFPSFLNFQTDVEQMNILSM